MSAEALPGLPVLPPVRNVLPGGRPTDYPDDVVRSLLQRVQEGKPLLAVCRDMQIPYGTVKSWAKVDPIFSANLASAREDSAEALVGEALTIIDEVPLQNEAVAKAKLQSGFRQWLASKYAAKVYGDKLEVQGDLTINITTKRYTPENTIDVEPEKPA